MVRRIMNYRHLYHAGNFADVVKHAVTALIVEYLKKKDAPFTVIDTHAGIGRYDLSSVQANKTGEWQEGIGRIWADPAPHDLLAPWLGAVRAMNPDGSLRWYPGSPRLIRHLLRRGDRLMAVELHPEDAATLQADFAGDPRTRVYGLDGFTALPGFVPPKEKRGLVLMDPAFEATDDFTRAARVMADAWKKWPGGIYAMWYPIKLLAEVQAFHDAVKESGVRKVLVAELTVRPGDNTVKLMGSGMVIVNPPWGLEDQLRDLLPWLQRKLERSAGGGVRLEWLVPETTDPLES
jgi:23S rRNA (adenine2030-N6)-methyltransferase